MTISKFMAYKTINGWEKIQMTFFKLFQSLNDNKINISFKYVMYNVILLHLKIGKYIIIEAFFRKKDF